MPNPLGLFVAMSAIVGHHAGEPPDVAD